MNNIPMLAQDLKNVIYRFLDTECGGDDVNEQEEKMYKALREATGYIDDFLSTQEMKNRKFEVGKTYYDSKFMNLMRVEKITEQGVKFKGAYGTSRRWIDLNNNEYVHGTYNVKA